jgi:hypothetical protein
VSSGAEADPCVDVYILTKAKKSCANTFTYLKYFIYGSVSLHMFLHVANVTNLELLKVNKETGLCTFAAKYQDIVV